MTSLPPQQKCIGPHRKNCIRPHRSQPTRHWATTPHRPTLRRGSAQHPHSTPHMAHRHLQRHRPYARSPRRRPYHSQPTPGGRAGSTGNTAPRCYLRLGQARCQERGVVLCFFRATLTHQRQNSGRRLRHFLATGPWARCTNQRGHPRQLPRCGRLLGQPHGSVLLRTRHLQP